MTRATELVPPVSHGLSSHAAVLAFEVIVSVMWSDGELTATEVERGRAAAKALRVRPRGGGAFAAIAEGPLSFPELPFQASLSPQERRFVMAAGYWIDAGNEESSERRSGFLRAVAARLKLEANELKELRHIARRASFQEVDPSKSFARLLDAVMGAAPLVSALA